MRFFSQGFSLGVVAAVALAVVPPAFAAASFVVRDIRVEGLQRVEPGTVFTYLPLKVGDTFDDEKGGDAVRALFATGFFKDVRLQNDQGVLVVVVEEQPAIAQITFSGAKEFKEDDFKKMLRTIGVAEARYYNKSVLEKAEQVLKREYVARGYYAAEVLTTVTPMERNRVSIVFTVEEGSIAKIRRVNIIGNKAFSESDLLNEMQLSTPNWLSWYTRTDQYSKQKLTADLEALRSYYLDRGYLEFVIESSQVSITPDKRDIFLTVSIKEGERFTVSGVTLAGELLDKQTELESKIKLKTNDVFSAVKLTESTKAITDLLGGYGYAFAAVNPQSKIDRDKRQVALTLMVDPGKRAYVRRISVAGNNSTRDEVVRRELRQLESAWFDAEKLQLSRDRLNRTGYFSDVNMVTDEVPNTSDQLDVTVNVVEKRTGSLSLGMGYSSNEKLGLTAGIQQENVFGTGTSLGLNINTSRVNRTLSITQFDPYFTVDGISRSTSVYYRTEQPSYYLGDSSFKLVTQGGSFKLGIPFSEIDRVYFGLGVERAHVTVSNNSSPNLLAFVKTYGNATSATTVNFPFTIGWARDGRDSALVPNNGRYQQANAEVGLLGGDLQYYQLRYQDQYYYPIAKGYTLAFNGEVGYGHGYGNKAYPVTKNYYVGGIGSVRGYAAGSIGPFELNSAKTEKLPTGGASKLLGSVEFTVPLPGSGIDRTVRLFGFFDAGTVYQEGQLFNTTDLRYSYGLGFSWLSPIGPLKFSYGIPLKMRAGDRRDSFQFQVGTAF
ncbi:MAG: outer membrane protein assembly factor BamA [Ottowia sp.]|nr:outer membrane protein assembly factor BamA [Ottowia sp.]